MNQMNFWNFNFCELNYEFELQNGTHTHSRPVCISHSLTQRVDE